MAGERPELIFLYGTLRRGASRDATVFYVGAEFMVQGRVRGLLHDFGEYPGFRSNPNAGWVTGEVFEVTPAALVLLDDWEGIPAGATEGGEYRRIRIDVTIADGSILSCWVYEAVAESVSKRLVIPSGDWLDK